jgi:hypothetical protein
MNTSIRTFLLCTSFFLLVNVAAGQNQTASELLRRFDTSGDGKLDEKEFAAALKKLGIPVKTAAGVKRAETARAEFNELSDNIKDAKKPFTPSQPRYRKRAAEAAKLLFDKERISLDSITSASALYRDFSHLTTYQRFEVKRALSDVPYADQSSAVDRSQPAASPPAGPVISFLEQNFRIRQDSSQISGPPVGDKPAKFAWTDARGEPTYYSIDGAVLYTPPWLDKNWDNIDSGEEETKSYEGWWFGWRIRPGFEAHVSTQTGANQDQLRYSLSLEGRDKWLPGPANGGNVNTESLPLKDFTDGKQFLSSNYFSIAPLYVTDRAADVRTWGMDMRYEPSVPWLNLNHDADKEINILGQKWLEGSMKGSIGFAFRDYDRGTAKIQTGTDYAAFKASYNASLTILSRLTLSASYSAMPIVSGDMASHDYFTLSAKVLVDERNHFSFGVDYSNGEQEPAFQKVDSVTAWVGVLF